MKVYAARGYVESLHYEDIEFIDTKSGTETIKTIKKLECRIRTIEDDIILPITFWGQKSMDLFLDIQEGSPVVCSFAIASKYYKDRYYINLKGYKIERYLGLTADEKEERSAKHRQQIADNKKEVENRTLEYIDPIYGNKTAQEIAEMMNDTENWESEDDLKYKQNTVNKHDDEKLPF